MPAAAALSSSALKQVGVGVKKLRHSIDFSHRPAARARAAVRRVAQAAWVHRWGGILSLAAQRALATSLIEFPPAAELGAAGDPPAFHELLADAR